MLAPVLLGIPEKQISVQVVATIRGDSPVSVLSMSIQDPAAGGESTANMKSDHAFGRKWSLLLRVDTRLDDIARYRKEETICGVWLHA
jgi:hypothetical protein